MGNKEPCWLRENFGSQVCQPARLQLHPYQERWSQAEGHQCVVENGNRSFCLD